VVRAAPDSFLAHLDMNWIAGPKRRHDRTHAQESLIMFSTTLIEPFVDASLCRADAP